MVGVKDSRYQVSKGRKQRRPEHRFYTEAYPWELTVNAVAPVLPGERMRRAVWQSRVVTDPLVSSVVGWWHEYFLFYVPLSLLPTFSEMQTNVEAGDLNDTFTASAADVPMYYAGRGVNWARECYNVIVREWFREEDEQAASPLPVIRTGRAAVRVGIDGVEHSLRLSSAWPGGDGGALGANQAAQEQAYRTWTILRDQGLVQMTYEDWLRTYGVSAPEAIRRRRPFLLRHVRDWTYPSNTVNQSNGVPVTACSWVFTEQASKARFITEPGFLVLLSAARPKIYRANQEAGGFAALDRLRYWLPAVLRDDPMTSIREDADNASPLYDDAVQAAAWTYDMRDLLTHGDQFVAQAFTAAQDAAIALPTAGAEPHYATQAMAESLFSNPGSGGLFFIRQDGIIRFEIDAAMEDVDDATARS